jgi:hypothetical protein
VTIDNLLNVSEFISSVQDSVPDKIVAGIKKMGVSEHLESRH